MSDPKSSFQLAPNDPNCEAPPPSYDESIIVSADRKKPQPFNSSSFIDTYIWPRLNGGPITTLVLVPPDVSSLAPPTDFSSPLSKSKTGSYGTFVGFRSEESPILIPLRGSENRLEAWQRPAMLPGLENQLRRRLNQEGHRLLPNETEVVGAAPSRIAGSRDVDWKYVEPNGLTAGQTRLSARMDEVCLRTENAMGLYETRSGKAIIITVELGQESEAGAWR
ncbi:MAG: hypothetical protein Q9174_005116 [Haloplaca sp. 1 TL-2023]